MGRFQGKCEGETTRYTGDPKEMKTHREVERNQLKNRSHTQREKNKKSNKVERWGTLPSVWPQGGGSCPLSHALALQSQSFLFIQHCNVWHFLRGGRVWAIVFLGCCSIGSAGFTHWNVSGLQLYLFDWFYLSPINNHLLHLEMGDLVSGEKMWWMISDRMDLASFFLPPPFQNRWYQFEVAGASWERKLHRDTTAQRQIWAFWLQLRQ